MDQEMNTLLSELDTQGKHDLASAIRANWKHPIRDYSTMLRRHTPNMPLEPTLRSAFEDELIRLGQDNSTIPKILSHLEHDRVIQTAPHLGPTQTSRMFCIDWLCTRNMRDGEQYVVGMFSGVPFSNSFRPGCINFSRDHTISEIVMDPKLCRELAESDVHRREHTDDDIQRKISLTPSSLQDTPVYGSVITQRTAEVVSLIDPKLGQYFPAPEIGESYTAWALGAIGNIEREILKAPITFLDINEVLTGYMLRVLDDPEHPFSKLLFDAETASRIWSQIPEHTFLGSYQKGSRYRQEPLYLRDGILVGAHVSMPCEKELIRRELLAHRLSAGTFLTFFILSFVNHFKCFGSFRQVEYLSRFKSVLTQDPLLSAYNVSVVPTHNLTTGMFPETPHLHPIDILLGSPFDPDESRPYGELILAMKHMLLL